MTVIDKCRPRSDLDRIICRPHAADIILYLSDTGECLKGDLYRDVCRGAAAMDRLETLLESGIITMSTSSSAGPCFLGLTPKGVRVAKMLKRLGDLVSEHTADDS